MRLAAIRERGGSRASFARRRRTSVARADPASARHVPHACARASGEPRSAWWQTVRDTPLPGSHGTLPGHATAWLVAILAVAGAVRLAGLTSAPPGVNQDEALSAWNAWCMLREGRALSGEPWPIFYCRNIGDFPTMLFFYVLLPFQAVGGLSVFTTRLPAALAGVLAVWSTWHVARALYGERAAAFAATALALAPWSIFLGHFGTGASLGPLQAALPLSMLAAARLLPGALRHDEAPVAAWALAAGCTLGIGTYGFHSLRLQLPLTFLLLFVLFPGHWRRAWSSARGRVGTLALATGFVVTFGPMAWMSFTDPHSLQRWQMTRLWPEGAPIETIARLVFERWALHFMPDFLFLRGDRLNFLNPAGAGALAWWMLPGLLAGAVAMLVAARRSPAARLGIALLLVYPVGDMVSAAEGVNSLRASAGLPALALAIGAGSATLLHVVRARTWLVRLVTVVLLATAFAEGAWYAREFLVRAPRERQIQIEYQGALLEAGPVLASYAKRGVPVYITHTGMNQPWVIVALGASVEPKAWFESERRVLPGSFDTVARFGPYHFIVDSLTIGELQALADNGRPDSVVFVVRPGEFDLANPVRRFRSPTGDDMLWVCEESL